MVFYKNHFKNFKSKNDISLPPIITHTWGRLVSTAWMWICKHVGSCEMVPLKTNSRSQ